MSETTFFSDGDLIEAVKQFPMLYNKWDPHYKNEGKIEKSWKQVEEIMNVKASICEHRWKVIRQRYSKERNKCKKRSLDCEKNTSKWPFFEQLSFLNEVMLSRNRGSVPKSGDSSTSQIKNQSLQEDRIEKVETFVDSPNWSSFSETSLPSTTPYAEKEIKYETEFLPFNYSGPSQQMENQHNPVTEPKELHNINYSFGRTIALLLEDVPIDEQRRKRSDILKLFTDN